MIVNDKIELVAQLVKAGLMTREEGLAQFGISVNKQLLRTPVALPVPAPEPTDEEVVVAFVMEKCEMIPDKGMSSHALFLSINATTGRYITQSKITNYIKRMRLPDVYHTNVTCENTGQRRKGFLGLRLR